jgi:type I restriction enzyme S subunit
MMTASILRNGHPSKNAGAPSTWRWCRLGDIVERIDYGFTASADFTVKGPRFLRISDIQDGNVDWETVPGCQIPDSEVEANRLLDGDIVFARTGATTGKSFLVREPPCAVFASYLIRLRAKPLVDPEFLSLFFQSEHYWKQIREQARGGIQPNFNATMLAALAVLIPPLLHQRRIAGWLREQLSTVAAARDAVRVQIETLDILIHAVLREALCNGGPQPVRFDEVPA